MKWDYKLNLWLWYLPCWNITYRLQPIFVFQIGICRYQCSSDHSCQFYRNWYDRSPSYLWLPKYVWYKQYESFNYKYIALWISIYECTLSVLLRIAFRLFEWGKNLVQKSCYWALLSLFIYEKFRAGVIQFKILKSWHRFPEGGTRHLIPNAYTKLAWWWSWV
jgi:hypothetical protein